MCYILRKKNNKNSAIVNNDEPICYFHDRESAQDVLDQLEMKDFMQEYIIHPYPTYRAENEHIPYCAEVLSELGIQVL
jgi:hypothetical protein